MRFLRKSVHDVSTLRTDSIYLPPIVYTRQWELGSLENIPGVGTTLILEDGEPERCVVFQERVSLPAGVLSSSARTDSFQKSSIFILLKDRNDIRLRRWGFHTAVSTAHIGLEYTDMRDEGKILFRSQKQPPTRYIFSCFPGSRSRRDNRLISPHPAPD
jgi:hypothetical protein